jgi:hypothetical protein
MSPETLILAWADALAARDLLSDELRDRYGAILTGMVPAHEWPRWCAALEAERQARAAVLAYAAAHRRAE